MLNSPPAELTRFRAAIDEIDRQLLDLLRQRFEICLQVADFKRLHTIPMMQPERVAHVTASRVAAGANIGLSPEFVESLYQLVIDEACRLEDRRMGRDAAPAAPPADCAPGL